MNSPHLSYINFYFLFFFLYLLLCLLLSLTLPFLSSQCPLPVWPDWLALGRPPWPAPAPWMGPVLGHAPTPTAPRGSARSPRPWRCPAKESAIDGGRQGGGSGTERDVTERRRRQGWLKLKKREGKVVVWGRGVSLCLQLSPPDLFVWRLLPSRIVKYHMYRY